MKRGSSIPQTYPLAGLRRRGYTLTEFLLVLMVIGILASIGLSAASDIGKRDLLSQSTDQVVALLNQAQEEAKAHREPVALLLQVDSLDSGPLADDKALLSKNEDTQNRLTITRYNPTGSLVNPLTDHLLLNQRWISLPKGIIVETTFSEADTPNAFNTDPNLGSTIAQPYAPNDKTYASRGLIFNAEGSVLASAGGNLSPFVNSSNTSTQKGCYVILRKARIVNGVATPALDATELHTVSKVYLSPLTGKVTKLLPN